MNATVRRVASGGSRSPCAAMAFRWWVSVASVDAHGLGQLTLVGDPSHLQRDQDQPDGEGTSGLGQGVVERPADRLGAPSQLETDGRSDGRRHGAY